MSKLQIRVTTLLVLCLFFVSSISIAWAGGKKRNKCIVVTSNSEATDTVDGSVVNLQQGDIYPVLKESKKYYIIWVRERHFKVSTKRIKKMVFAPCFSEPVCAEVKGLSRGIMLSSTLGHAVEVLLPGGHYPTLRNIILNNRDIWYELRVRDNLGTRLIWIKDRYFTLHYRSCQELGHIRNSFSVKSK
ncbi:MAG: hypothetical protein HN353_04575 [Bdellovibrionales bacterium]|nr:hypothetical protein [Bdellovibrionales bacterium]MBT3527440.1 hypothetical protein [Bdellovibrionales bacterium]MBT7669469.1 hypothetical protein [Bdellovibrionales bacterium]MBT7767812.1 hypothetical protein [Bdellovibrionales bacterium]